MGAFCGSAIGFVVYRVVQCRLHTLLRRDPPRFLSLLTSSESMNKTFEDLRAFQRALDLMVDVYAATEALPKSDLRPLLRRAAGSVMSHTAEGQGRIPRVAGRRSETMNITFDAVSHWMDGLDGLGSWATVDGKRVHFILEGRALAEYFGVENKPWPIQAAYIRNHEFVQEIVRDAIQRGKFNPWGEVLLGKKDLIPYFEKRSATAPA
jgi:hypothetical protein